jgi:hypothetical protein
MTINRSTIVTLALIALIINSCLTGPLVSAYWLRYYALELVKDPSKANPASITVGEPAGYCLQSLVVTLALMVISSPVWGVAWYLLKKRSYATKQ